ncbi:hypothetical protein GGI21_006543, partial [Coemansia aciculifera]
MQLAQYQYSPRNLAAAATAAVAERPRAAVADYFDPYSSPASGQQQTLLKVESSPRPTAPAVPVSIQAPSSPVMRATRHSRPTTPTTTTVQTHSSHDSLRNLGGLLAEPGGGGIRTKPRAYTATDDDGVARPRVSSMYATSGFVPSSSPKQQTDASPGSRLSRPIARPRPPQQPINGGSSPTPASTVPMERSELIDFIERRRAQTFAPAEPSAMPAPAIAYGKPRASTAVLSESDAAPRMERSESVSSRRSDT